MKCKRPDAKVDESEVEGGGSGQKQRARWRHGSVGGVIACHTVDATLASKVNLYPQNQLEDLV